jgi:hypothetical protein
MAASQGCAEPLIPQPCGAWHSPAFKRYDRITTKSELGARAAIFIAVDPNLAWADTQVEPSPSASRYSLSRGAAVLILMSVSTPMGAEKSL